MVDRDGERMTFHEELYACYPAYARVSNFDTLEGEAAALGMGSQRYDLISLDDK